jgi:hypothetical protein
MFILLSELRHRCSVSNSLSLRPLPPTALSVQLLKKKRRLETLQMMMVALWLRCVYLDDVLSFTVEKMTFSLSSIKQQVVKT